MKIIALIMSFIIALTSCTIPSKAYDPLDIIRDTVRVIDKNIQNAVDTVEHATDMVWNNINATIDYLTVKRKTNYPTSDYNSSPNYTTTYNDYTCNYYTVDNSSSSNYYTTENNSYTSNSYYDYNTYNYYTTNNATYITNTTNNYEYNTYQYEFNDNRVFITEAYNCVVYTYINPDTKTVDSYMCSFELPSGDNSFNYSSGYCYGLYWVYDIVNYEYELDNSNILALWRFDGDLHNEVPDSPYEFIYQPNDFGDGKFGYSMRLNGPYDFVLHRTDGRDPYNIMVTAWYYNGDPNYKGMTMGWHYLAWSFEGTTRHVYVDGVLRENSSFAQLDISSGAIFNATENYNGSNVSITLTPSDKKSIVHIDAYHPYEGEPLIIQSVGSNNIVINDGVDLLSRTDAYDYLNTDVPNFTSSVGKDLSPFFYPPLKRGADIYFLWSGTQKNIRSGLLYYQLGNVPIAIGHKYNTYAKGLYNLSSTFNPSAQSFSLMRYYPDLYIQQSMGAFASYVRGIYEGVGWTEYDLSGCFFDEMTIYSGLDLNYLKKIPSSRTELEVGYTIPTTPVSANTIGLQSTVKCNNFRVGGVIPTVAHQGDVWFKLKDGYCVDCVQYIDGSWQPINFGVYNGDSWVNGYTYNFYQLSFDTVDIDSGTNSSVIYNYYYSGDNIYNDYFDNSATDDEKESVFSFMTNIVTLLGTLFVFIGGALPIFSFMPTWAIGILFTFLPVCSILIVISITKHFLGGKK